MTAVNPEKPAILLAAYQCGPGMGSVSQIGWEWFRRLAEEHTVTLVTHSRNRPAIEAAAEHPRGSEIIYIDTEWFAGPLYRHARRLFPHSEHGVFLVSSLDFFLFDAIALRRLRLLKESRNWRLLHIVTPVTLAAPSCLHRLGLPVVRGPLNCGLHSPPGFESLLRHEKPWLIRLRQLPRLLDGLLGATRNTRLILTATSATRAALPPRHHARCRPMIENGVDLAAFPAIPWPAPPSDRKPLRVLFVGRMIALKGVDMLLDAVANLQCDGHLVELTLVGDGPERANWMQKATALGLRSTVRFTGALPAAGVAAEMHDCHVFCLPSVRESGGAVLLEAMACARPVIAVAHGGPAEIVDAAVGCAIAATSPTEVRRALQATLTDVIARPAHWAELGRNGRARVEQHYDWRSKIRAAREIYDEVLAGT